MGGSFGQRAENYLGTGQLGAQKQGSWQTRSLRAWHHQFCCFQGSEEQRNCFFGQNVHLSFSPFSSERPFLEGAKTPFAQKLVCPPEICPFSSFLSNTAGSPARPHKRVTMIMVGLFTTEATTAKTHPESAFGWVLIRWALGACWLFRDFPIFWSFKFRTVCNGAGPI